MNTEREVIINDIPTGTVRAPGGHWYRYRAVYADDLNGPTGLGQTEREARVDLQKQASLRDD
jgi:hypothetical protein